MIKCGIFLTALTVFSTIFAPCFIYFMAITMDKYKAGGTGWLVLFCIILIPSIIIVVAGVFGIGVTTVLIIGLPGEGSSYKELFIFHIFGILGLTLDYGIIHSSIEVSKNQYSGWLAFLLLLSVPAFLSTIAAVVTIKAPLKIVFNPLLEDGNRKIICATLAVPAGLTIFGLVIAFQKASSNGSWYWLVAFLSIPTLLYVLPITIACMYGLFCLLKAIGSAVKNSCSCADIYETCDCSCCTNNTNPPSCASCCPSGDDNFYDNQFEDVEYYMPIPHIHHIDIPIDDQTISQAQPLLNKEKSSSGKSRSSHSVITKSKQKHDATADVQSVHKRANYGTITKTNQPDSLHKKNTSYSPVMMSERDSNVTSNSPSADFHIDNEVSQQPTKRMRKLFIDTTSENSFPTSKCEQKVVTKKPSIVTDHSGQIDGQIFHNLPMKETKIIYGYTNSNHGSSESFHSQTEDWSLLASPYHGYPEVDNETASYTSLCQTYLEEHGENLSSSSSIGDFMPALIRGECSLCVDGYFVYDMPDCTHNFCSQCHSLAKDRCPMCTNTTLGQVVSNENTLSASSLGSSITGQHYDRKKQYAARYPDQPVIQTEFEAIQCESHKELFMSTRQNLMNRVIRKGVVCSLCINSKSPYFSFNECYHILCEKCRFLADEYQKCPLCEGSWRKIQHKLLTNLG